MPTRKRRGSSGTVNGLSEAAYTFFGDGPFFEGRTFEQRTTAAERAEIWKAHRGAIIDRWRDEHPQHSDLCTWGEQLEMGGP